MTNTPPGRIPGQAAGLELRHRQHARVEDRIREAKASGLGNLPWRGWDENAAWLEVVLTAIDLVTCSYESSTASTATAAFESLPDGMAVDGVVPDGMAVERLFSRSDA